MAAVPGRTPGPGAVAGRTAPATAGTVLGLLLAVGGAVVLAVDATPPERWWGALSFPLVWATPAVLALLARRRPALLVPAALLAGGLAVLSLSGVTLVLLVPAGLWLAALRRGGLPWPGPARTAVLVALPLVGLAAFGALLVHEDPVCWDVVRTPGGDEAYRVRPGATCAVSTGVATATAGGSVVGGGSTSDVVVAGEAVLSGLLLAGTLGIGWLAAPAERS